MATDRLEKRLRRIDRLVIEAQNQRDAELALMGSDVSELAQLPLMRFVPAAMDDMGDGDVPPMEPKHLGQLVDALEAAERGDQPRFCLSVPPQHGKTVTLVCGIVWYMLRHPTHDVLYASATSTKAQSWRPTVERMLKKCGARIASARDDRIQLVDGGRIIFRAMKGDIIGKKQHLIVIDDPHKDVVEALSPILSQQIRDRMDTSVSTRIVPGHTGIIVVHQRLARSDLIGYLEEKDGWDVVNLPAEDEHGNLLWPERFGQPDPETGKRRIDRIREDVGPYAWETLYMGRPMSRGATLFDENGLRRIAVLPDPSLCKRMIGIDCAYSLRSSADYNAIVELWELDGSYHIAYAWRGRCRPEEFASKVKGLYAQRSAPIVWHGAGQERPTADHMRNEHGLPIRFHTAHGTNKRERAFPVAAAWNRGAVLVPEHPKGWHIDGHVGDPASGLVRELLGFTGNHETHDDLVDALSSAFLELRRAPGIGWRDAQKQHASLKPAYRI